MSGQDFQIDLGDGRSVVVAASSPEEAASAARAFVAGEKGRGLAKENPTAGFLDSVAKGQSSGLSDELGAATNATFASASRAVLNTLGLRQPQPADNDTWSQRYDQNLGFKRGFSKQYQEDHPVAAGAGQLTGGAMTSLAMAPAIAPAFGPSLMSNIVKGAAFGAGAGGAQGFNEGEGGLADRLANAGTGAIFGGGIGGALPVGGSLVRQVLETGPGRKLVENVVSPVARRLAGMFEGAQPAKSLSAAAPDGTAGVTGTLGQFADTTSNVAQNGAIDRVATALQRSGMSREQIERRLQQLGPEGFLADVDPQLLSQARMANTMPGETRSVAKNVLESRDRQAGNRIVSAFEGDQPPPSSYQLRGEGQAFDENARAVGNRAYQGDMVDAGLKQSPEMMALYENPYVDQALTHVMDVEKKARIGRPDAQPSSPIEIMHKVKQAIWDLGFDKETARPGPMASWYRDLGTDYVNKLKAANPALAAADRDYAQAASLPEFFDRGRSFLSKGSSEKATEASAPGLADLLAKADPQQTLAARAGSTNAARETALEGTRPARALAQRIDESAPVRDKLVELYGSDHGGRILQRASNERTFAETSNDILRGSKTADKLAEAMDTGNAGFRVSDSGVKPRLFETLKDLMAKVGAPNEAVRNEIGRAMLNADPQEKERILRLAFESVAKRKRGSAIGTALPAAVGGQFSSSP